MLLSFAFCTFNRADRLEKLVAAMRAQVCPVAFEILAVNNNSSDATLAVLDQLSRLPGAPLRVVTETAPGIVPARNRALREAIDSDMLVFIDDDELPRPGLLRAATDALINEGAACAGGRIILNFAPYARPDWLSDDLLGFLAGVDYGSEAFWITTPDTPIWTGNIAYAMRLFRDDPALRFDARYNRAGTAVGGGEDIAMFSKLLTRGVPMRYRPDMQVENFVESWRLRRRYFLKLHYQAGLRKGQHELPRYARTLFGVPPFLLLQLLRQGVHTLRVALTRPRGFVRQAMNATHAWGLLKGYANRRAGDKP